MALIKRIRLAIIATVVVVIAAGTFFDSPTKANPFSPANTKPEPPTSAVPIDAVYTVTRVIDGDTIELQSGEDVRLIGVDTPETKHPTKPVGCFGPEASAWLTKQLPHGTQVMLVSDKSRTDHYGRRLAYVYLTQDRMLNAELILEGYGYAKAFAPDTAHADEFEQLQQQAKAARKGVWSAKCEGAAS